VVDQLAPGPLVGLVHGRPGAPALDRVVQAPGDLVLGPHMRLGLPAAGVLEGEPGRLAGIQGDPAGGGRPLQGQSGRHRQQQQVRPTPGADAPLHVGEDGVDQPVLRARRVADLQLHGALGAGHPAQQRPRGAGAEVVAAVVAADGQGVDQDGGPGGGPEGGLQGHRLVDVGAGHLGPADRPDGEVAGVLVEQAGEHARPVEPGEAQPVHRPGPADQRGRAAVRQQGVLGQREGAHDGGPAAQPAPRSRAIAR
jgi:hypothetical protein